MASALYVPDGDQLVPTELTGGPWSPDAQHGGAVASLLARAVEAVPEPATGGPLPLDGRIERTAFLRAVDFHTHTFINADLTVALARPPASEWVGFDMGTRLSPDGYDQCESLVFDRHGALGRAIQCLIVDQRAPGQR